MMMVMISAAQTVLTYLRLLQKLTGFQLVKKFPAFYGNNKLAPRLQEPAICPYPKPDQSSS